MTTRLELDPVPSAVRTARAAVLSDDVIANLPEETKRNIALIVSELLTNAVAAATGPGPVIIEVFRAGSSVTILVSNAGTLDIGDDVFSLPPPEEPRGRGLGIVAKLAREVEMTNSAGTTTVRAVVEAVPA